MLKTILSVVLQFIKHLGQGHAVLSCLIRASTPVKSHEFYFMLSFKCQCLRVFKMAETHEADTFIFISTENVATVILF